MRNGMRQRPAAAAALLFGLASCTAPEPSTNAAPARPQQDTLWVVVRQRDGIPPAVLRMLEARFDADERLADRGEPFEATDVLSGRPRRRLITAGHAGETWLVAYEHGGIALHLHIVMVDLADGSSGMVDHEPLEIAYGEGSGWTVDLEAVSEAMGSGRVDLLAPQEEDRSCF